MINLDEIVVDELQLTTRCNGKCPLCMRQRVPFKIKDMETAVVKNLYPYKRVSFVGPLGDATLHPKIDEIIEIVKDKGSRIHILTNASTHNNQWWANLAKQLEGRGDIDNGRHSISFSLDGLKGTHEFYRGPNVKFENVISNIKSFIDAGGQAHCTTILFKHNEDEINEIENLAYSLGCLTHRIKISWKYNNKLLRPTKWKVKTRSEMANERQGKKHKFICDFFDRKAVSIDMLGRIHPCCRFSQQFLTQEIVNDIKLFIVFAKDQSKLHDLKYAVNSPYFNYIKDHFNDIKWCKEFCKGSALEFSYDQYEWTDEIWQIIKDFNDNEVFEATTTDQNKCKKWVLEELNRAYNYQLNPNHCAQYLPKTPKSIVIACGWYSIMANYLFRFADFDINKIVSIDKNPKYKKPAEIINKQFSNKFTALTNDIFDVLPQHLITSDTLVINTSCEHIDLRRWLDTIPKGTTLVLQSTNMSDVDHINCVKNIKEFKDQAAIYIFYEGEKIINWGHHKRFMLIGTK